MAVLVLGNERSRDWAGDTGRDHAGGRLDHPMVGTDVTLWSICVHNVCESHVLPKTS